MNSTIKKVCLCALLCSPVSLFTAGANATNKKIDFQKSPESPVQATPQQPETAPESPVQATPQQPEIAPESPVQVTPPKPETSPEDSVQVTPPKPETSPEDSVQVTPLKPGIAAEDSVQATPQQPGTSAEDEEAIKFLNALSCWSPDSLEVYFNEFYPQLRLDPSMPISTVSKISDVLHGSVLKNDPDAKKFLTDSRVLCLLCAKQAQAFLSSGYKSFDEFKKSNPGISETLQSFFCSFKKETVLNACNLLEKNSANIKPEDTNDFANNIVIIQNSNESNPRNGIKDFIENLCKNIHGYEYADIGAVYTLYCIQQNPNNIVFKSEANKVTSNPQNLFQKNFWCNIKSSEGNQLLEENWNTPDLIKFADFCNIKASILKAVYGNLNNLFTNRKKEQPKIIDANFLRIPALERTIKSLKLEKSDAQKAAQQIHPLKVQYANLEKEYRKSKGKIKNLEKQVSELTNAADFNAKNIRNLEEKLNESKDFHVIINDFKVNTQKDTEKIKKLGTQIDGLQKELIESMQENECLKFQLENSKATLEKKRKTISILKQKLSASNSSESKIYDTAPTICDDTCKDYINLKMPIPFRHIATFFEQHISKIDEDIKNKVIAMCNTTNAFVFDTKTTFRTLPVLHKTLCSSANKTGVSIFAVPMFNFPNQDFSKLNASMLGFIALCSHSKKSVPDTTEYNVIVDATDSIKSSFKLNSPIDRP